MGATTDISGDTLGVGASSFIKIASLSNIDLETIQANVLTYESGISAANCVPTNIVIKRANVTDTYSNVAASEVLGAGQISIDSGVAYTGIQNGSLTINVGATTICFVPYTFPTTETKAQVKASIIASMIGGWTATNNVGDIIIFREPTGQGGDFNGQQIAVVLNRITLTTSGATTMSGGSTTEATDYNYKDNTTILKQKSSSNFTNLPNMTTTSEKLMEVLDDDTLFSGAGDKSFNVTGATGSQFLINVEVWGIKTS